MFYYHRTTIWTIGALLLLLGVNSSYAQKTDTDKTHAQAIESVKKNLARDPKNEGMQNALHCLESANQCNDQRKLEKAMGSVKDSLAHHPEDSGMHHAMDQLEQHHQRFEHEHMKPDGTAPRDHASPHAEMPHSSGSSERSH
jgi:hypothetical protein